MTELRWHRPRREPDDRRWSAQAPISQPGMHRFGPPLAILADGPKNMMEISELPFEVSITAFEYEGLDTGALAARLEASNFAGLVAIVESLGF